MKIQFLNEKIKETDFFEVLTISLIKDPLLFEKVGKDFKMVNKDFKYSIKID